MKRFRTKKDRSEISIGRPSVEESSSPFKMFSRNKKSNDDGNKDVDLTAALPPSDDFRTSLLMTGLSARFSMLREQDDPTSKLGKASDDSVLFPKRQSRMDLLGGGLGDIAEVESIRHPIHRSDSFQSSEDTPYTGSMMNRAKPTEGNNLFGGRQKIYKISAGVTAKNGGMSGRALYDDDVAHSAFQRWRQSERDRRSSEEDLTGSSLDIDRSLEFDRRRETTSTTASDPSAARNSTAATSINSQMGVPAKEQPPTATSSNSTERSVTRTRRLYEQGLNQDLHDQQNSAVSRFDSISRPRPLAARMAELGTKAPGSGLNGQTDRERRSIQGKASAPNLRSYNPPTNGSAFSTPTESTPKFPTLEHKSSYTTSPPLSPPISEAEDHPILSIGPNDRGKATAMGVFARPAQQYDESRYAQRQRQLQQGRDSPSSRFRTESDASDPTSRSRSSSSMQRAPYEKSEGASRREELSVDEETQAPNDSSRQNPTLQITVDRPDDQDHPAFRHSALPTPLSIAARASNEPSPISETHEDLYPDTSAAATLKDSPTLGPPAGLSGMVRQHLRNVSTTSSVYANEQDEQDEAGPDVSVLDHHRESLPGVSIDTNDWGLNESDWHASHDMDQVQESSLAGDNGMGSNPGETDEFARHLAEGARRVREKLTSYAEPDGRSTPPALAYADLITPKPSSSNGLKSKSSKSSLADRGRATGEGMGRFASLRGRSSSRGTSKKQVADEPLPVEEEMPAVEAEEQPEKEPVHAGLKAFRQARRELQRMKQMETQRRHDVPASPPQAPEGVPPPPPPNRTPPQPYFEQGSRGVASNPGSRSGSRAGYDRERSGSETSYGAMSPPIKSRNIRMPPSDDAGSPIPSPAIRSATMPSNESRRLPISRTASENTTLGSTSSAPNLKAAPPLPPINPRRKTPQGRGGSVRRSDEEEGLGLLPSPDKMGRFSDPEYADQLRGRGFRASPPRPIPRPPPQSNHSSSSMPGGFPGGMI